MTNHTLVGNRDMTTPLVELSGIVILAVGVWMQVELYKYMELSTEFSSTAPYVLIATGALIVVVGFLACCCTVKGQPVLLYIYGAFLMIIFVLELGAGISMYAYRDKLIEGFDNGLNQSILIYPSDPEKKNSIDLTQSTLHCCGNKSPYDWPDEIPPSCCKVTPCDTKDHTQIYSKGCFNLVIDFLNSNIGLVGGSAMGIAFFPLVGMLLSCCLAKNINKAKYEQMA
ncbi:Tetraspanin [Gryllus bimaculatus]|nr:Tetraspanin [Gryllus bimaculatus]